LGLKDSKGILGLGGSSNVRLILDYVDPKNYIECEIDKQSYASAEHRNGKKIDHVKKRPHGINLSSFRIQLAVEANSISIQVRSGDKWEPLDRWNDSGHNFADGRFGFRLPNQDQVFMTDFWLVQQAGNR